MKSASIYPQRYYLFKLKTNIFITYIFIYLQVSQAPSAPSKLGTSAAAKKEFDDLEKQLAQLKS